MARQFMLELLGYQVSEKLYESYGSVVYRGTRQQDNQPVIFKMLKGEYPSPEAIARYKLEYEITRNFNLEGIVKAYSLEKYQHSFVMILEDFGGESLNILINHKKISLKEFLHIAILTTDILGEIHQQNIIHKDINPANIVFNRTTGQVKIIDFGLATVLSQEKLSFHNPHILEGTLAYISPEQTGRMNRAIDYRSDFYSLGVTFYQLLTQQLPFDASDAMELVHCHIAKQPIPPHEINSEIPQPVSEIIIKLLAKTAEYRYQSVYGIKADLENCLTQLQINGTIQDFSLAQKDISDKFRIPQKLYGREQEIQTLLTAFDRVAAHSCATEKSRSEMMLISGYSGIGKSALVNEVHKPITRQRGYFISGKFDQLQKNIPYSSVIQAFQGLIRQLLTENESQIAIWQQKLLTALASNGQIIIDVIPEVELIIGKQPPVVKLAPTESQNRFNLVFQRFIKVFTQPEHPLVIFLDDLQWADIPSLKLIQLLMTQSDSQYLLLVGAYRDNEVNSTHALTSTLDEIKKTSAIINHVSLLPLDSDQINQLIADTLNCQQETTSSLAQLVLQKTNGNPFFINEVLKSLYTEKLIHFDFTHYQWRWDLTQIKAATISDNVVDLMAAKIKKMFEPTQQVLKLAACIGNQFDLKTLAIVNENSQLKTAKQLWEAIQAGLILPITKEYKFLIMNEEREGEDDSFQFPITYKFLHDRVQQAAYYLIPEPEKQILHLQIGRLLLKNTLPEKREKKIFDLVNQLNCATELIIEPSERQELAQLNLIAGKKAKASAAYEPAFKYLNIGTTLLGGNNWQQHYDLTLAVYVEAAEAAYLSSDFAQMERLAEVVLQQAKTLLDKVKVYEVKIQACIAQNNQLLAVKTALPVLALLGVKFPKNPQKIHIWLESLKTKLALQGKPVEDLINLPEMTDPYKLAIMRILSKIFSAAYMTFPELMPLIVLKQVNLSIRYGNTAISTFSYGCYGLVLCGIEGDIESGYRFSQVAINLLNKFDIKELHAKLLMTVNTFVRHWKEHAREVLNPLIDAYQIGTENGDLLYAAISIQINSFYSYFIGKELAVLEQEIASYSATINKTEKTALYLVQMYRQVIWNLIGKSDLKHLLVGELYNEEQMLPIHQATNNTSSISRLYLHKLVLCYLFQEFDQALENAKLVETYLGGLTGMLVFPVFHFYDSLARLAVYTTANQSEQKRLLTKVIDNQKKMQHWANYAPMNHLHKFYLVEAERYRILAEDALAIDYYDRAITLAKENEYINEEALAHELAAKFYLAKGKTNIARAYMLDARYCYIRWGAIAKVKDLEKQYPQLLLKSSISIAEYNTGTNIIDTKKTVTITSDSSRSEALDLTTVMKASQALSGEIRLDKLLAELMKISIENAGAQKGYLILDTKGKLFIEAEGTVAQDSITVLQSIPLEQSQVVSLSIINYVFRTKESLVLHDASREGKFANDPYIIANKPKSILCTPLINQAKINGILYLENNLTTDAFIPARLEVLNILSSQAAISIENARLYKDMADLNTAYARFVPREFLQFLHKESIIDVKLGDQVQREMSVLFSDIRSFTTLSESMTPEQNFRFINSYLSRMEPVIIANHGFIDKYIGDAIMALFSGSANDAVNAGIAMLRTLVVYNQHRAKSGYIPIQNGIGINTGSLMLGTVGGHNRMDGTVISDAVNLASRIEGLTKNYGVSLLITHQTFICLDNPEQYAIRMVDTVKVKGKSEAVIVYEVFDADLPKVKEAKLATAAIFKQALSLYHQQNFSEAKQIFQNCIDYNPMDTVAQIYLERCQ